MTEGPAGVPTVPPTRVEKVVLATRNRGKLGELTRLLAGLRWNLVALDQCPRGAQVCWEEDGATYQENAAIKAWATARGTGLAALADDSGLELDALAGWPGLHTARWMGGQATSEELLQGIAKRVAQLAPDRRGATFRCVLAYAPLLPERSTPVFAEGTLRGTLLSVPRGNNGFGYDPIFVPSGYSRTLAEMEEVEKDSISHRGLAARAMVAAVLNSSI